MPPLPLAVTLLVVRRYVPAVLVELVYEAVDGDTVTASALV